jgi:hypothetical protein
LFVVIEFPLKKIVEKEQFQDYEYNEQLDDDDDPDFSSPG